MRLRSQVNAQGLPPGPLSQAPELSEDAEDQVVAVLEASLPSKHWPLGSPSWYLVSAALRAGRILSQQA